MKVKYARWIEKKLKKENPALACVRWTEQISREFPELKRIKGYINLSNYSRMMHFWLLDEEGNIIDPTASQFNVKKYNYSRIVDYIEETREIFGKCVYCGDPIFIGDFRPVCSEGCKIENEKYLNKIKKIDNLASISITFSSEKNNIFHDVMELRKDLDSI